MRVWAVTMVALAALVSTASAVPPKKCDPVAVAGKGYDVTGHGVKCSFARKWVKRNLRKGTHPKGYACSAPSSGSNVRVYCKGSTKPKGDPTFRYFYGILQ